MEGGGDDGGGGGKTSQLLESKQTELGTSKYMREA